MAQSTKKPSSNKQDAALTGPNASRGASSVGARGGFEKSANDDTQRVGTGSSGTQRSAGAEQSGMQTVAEVMTRDVCLIAPEQTLREAATMMADSDVGSLPVAENDRLVGILTDRDIVLRAVAEGRDPGTTVRDVMTDRIQYCYEDETIDEVARHMAELEVRRLPVINREKRLVGIVALSNIALCSDNSAKTAFLDSVATPH